MNILFATRSRYPGGISPFRRQLFERVCAASLASQTDNSFEWWLILHPDETQDSRTATLHPDLRDRMRCVEGWSQLAPSPPYVMFRIDDDDMISSDFVERVRRYLSAAHSRPITPGDWLTFPNGHILHNGRLAHWTLVENQFIGLVGGNVYHKAHRDYAATRTGKRRCRVIDRIPAFVWMRHAETVSASGRNRGGFKVPAPTQRRFQVDWNVALQASRAPRLLTTSCADGSVPNQ